MDQKGKRYIDFLLFKGQTDFQVDQKRFENVQDYWPLIGLFGIGGGGFFQGALGL